MTKKKFFETESFKKQNREWYGKLRENGFSDIESKSNIDNDSITRQEFKVNPARIKYIHECETFLHKGKFDDELDHFIFTLHCEGRTGREIERLLKSQNVLPQADRRTVDRRLLKILKAANIEPFDFGGV